ncbi:MAG: hypothetical protein M1828_003280 [Chrysothrix sp. TS-e1954]|nr:MAG: hypothetical protein M1828_003280 [Chrysothrix sp. TS-e1954]
MASTKIIGRRSGRKRKPNTRYENAIDGDELGEYISPEREPLQAPKPREAKRDDEFVMAEAAAEPDDVDDADEEEADLFEAALEEQDPSSGTEHNDGQSEGSDNTYDVDEDEPQEKAKKTRETHRDSGSQKAEDLRSRGVDNLGKHKSKDLSLIYYLGNDERSTRALLESRDKWFDEITLPSRRPDELGIGGMRQSFWVPDDVRKTRADTSWAWYFRGNGADLFQRYQKAAELEVSAVTSHFSERRLPASVVLGPVSNQGEYTIDHDSCFNLSRAFRKTLPPTETADDDFLSDCGRGWLINTGNPVACVDWAPNQTSTLQYLAVATRPKKTSSLADDSLSETQRSCIQVWQCHVAPTTRRGSGARPMDHKGQPSLRLQLSFDHGPLRAVKWCLENRPRNASEYVDEGRFSNLLGTLDGAGTIRVLDIGFSQAARDVGTQHIHVQRAAFESKPPSATCTCIAWMSSNLIAAGCSNGYIAVWDISAHLTSVATRVDDDDPPAAKPILYTQVHHSHIITLTPCHPSNPHLVMTTCADGTSRLTDLRAPTMDYVLGARSRLPTVAVSWYEHMQHFIFHDHNDGVRASNVRTFVSTTVVARQQPAVRVLASSPIHAAVLVGAANGELMVFNPGRRIMANRSLNSLLQQTIFAHTWRRGRSVSLGTDGDASESSLDYPNGLSRILTGFPIHNAYVPGGTRVSYYPKPGRKNHDPRSEAFETSYATIHERETAITAVCWNPNEIAGGWAAAGMGSGLLWVGDLCWD